MSRYLIQRIEENPKIEMHYHTEIVGLDGDHDLRQVTWVDKTTKQTSKHDIGHVFIMAGAAPRTDWLKDCVVMDDKGFILTGRDLETSADFLPTRGLRLGLLTCWRPVCRECLRLAMCAPGT